MREEIDRFRATLDDYLYRLLGGDDKAFAWATLITQVVTLVIIAWGLYGFLTPSGIEAIECKRYAPLVEQMAAGELCFRSCNPADSGFYPDNLNYSQIIGRLNISNAS
jgi:hypothetical protein